MFVEGLGPPLLMRAILATVGAALYFVVAPKIIMPGLNTYLGRDPAVRAIRVRQLSLFPYVVGGVTYVLAGLLNPKGMELVLLSAAAASFGGTSFLAWYPGGRGQAFRDSAPERPASLRSSKGWMATACVVFVGFVGVLGRGLSF